MITLTYAQKENIGFPYVTDMLQVSSPYGRQLVRDLRPYSRAERPELLRQLSNVQRVLEGEASCKKSLDRMLRVFMTVKDVRASVIRCGETALNEIELFEVKCFLLRCHEIQPLFREVDSLLELEGVVMEDTTAALDILDPEGNRTAAFFIPDRTSPRLLALRKEKRELEEQIRRLPDGEERETLRGERVRTAVEEELEENRIRGEMSQALRPYIPAILRNMDTIGELDLTVEKARLARRYGGVMPQLTERTLDMTDMTNPMVVDVLREQGKAFTPVSISLERGAAVITGANMGGKSVAIKTLALNVLLTHCGLFPFAREAKVPMFDGLYLLAEDGSSVERCLSSFGGEMVRFNEMVREMAGEFPLVLLDEFARGTNPDEGAAIVQAVTRYLDRQDAISVLATHYDRVARWGSAHYQVIGLKDMDPETVRKEIAGLSGNAGVELIGRYMNYGLYRVEEQRDCPRDALNICRLLGMEPEILNGVEEFLTDVDKRVEFGV